MSTRRIATPGAVVIATTDTTRRLKAGAFDRPVSKGERFTVLSHEPDFGQYLVTKDGFTAWWIDDEDVAIERGWTCAVCGTDEDVTRWGEFGGNGLCDP